MAKAKGADEVRNLIGLLGRVLRRGLQWFVLGAIRCYQNSIRLVMFSHCRFYPSCSHYAAEAIEKHGIAKGGLMAIRRLLKCHPLHEGGVDPVPDELATFGPTHQS